MTDSYEKSLAPQGKNASRDDAFIPQTNERRFSLSYFLLLFVIISPNGLIEINAKAEAVVNALKVVVFLYEAFRLPSKKIPFTGMFLLLIIESLWTALVAVINGVGYLDVCKTAVAHLLTYLVINSVMEKQESFALFFRTTLLYLLFWTIPNLLSVIIFEDGIYYDEIYSNGIYILGGKNSFTPFLIITVWLCFLYGALYRSGHSILLTWSAIVIAFLSGLFGGSGTLTIVSLIFAVIALFGNGFTLSPRVIFVALILIEILVVVVRVQTLFGWFFELFGKDASFTGRIELWDSGLRMIGKKPIFGYGNPGFGIIWDPTHLEWYSAHNALLDKCLRFGIPGMLIYLAIYMQPFLTLQGEREWNNAILYGLSMAFLTGLTETYLWSNAYLFAYIFICLGYPRFFREKAEHPYGPSRRMRAVTITIDCP